MTGLTTTAPMAATLDQAVAGDQTAFARIVAAYHDLLRGEVLAVDLTHRQWVLLLAPVER